MLEATFVRRPGLRDRIYVLRDDGSSTGWDFPASAEGPPHDLCHLVIEDELGLTEGFWGLVDQGAEVGLVDNQATLFRNGRPLGDEPGFDFSGLRAAEAAVVVLTGHGLGGASLEESLARTEAAQAALGRHNVQRIRARLGELTRAWSELDGGGAICLPFPGPPTDPHPDPCR